MAETALAERAASGRNLAFLNYGLLFASVFFAGVPALVAVIVAYSQKDQATPDIRAHHDFQIRIFWVALATTLIAAASVLGVVMGLVGELIEMSRSQGWRQWDDVRIEFRDLSIDTGVVLMGASALLRRVPWSWQSWLALLIVELGNETHDMLNPASGEDRIGASLHDIWVTMFAPTLLLVMTPWLIRLAKRRDEVREPTE